MTQTEMIIISAIIGLLITAVFFGVRQYYILSIRRLEDAVERLKGWIDHQNKQIEHRFKKEDSYKNKLKELTGLLKDADLPDDWEDLI
jgi:uncharacterized membrane-anchored protein YhcB (DUF1043 family)